MGTQSKLGQLASADVLKSAISAAFAAVLVGLAGTIGPSFDLFNIDWHALLNMIVGTGISAFLGDIIRRLASDQDGALFGAIGGSK